MKQWRIKRFSEAVNYIEKQKKKPPFTASIPETSRSFGNDVQAAFVVKNVRGEGEQDCAVQRVWCIHIKEIFGKFY